jgi:hypothetical protein
MTQAPRPYAPAAAPADVEGEEHGPVAVPRARPDPGRRLGLRRWRAPWLHALRALVVMIVVLPLSQVLLYLRAKRRKLPPPPRISFVRVIAAKAVLLAAALVAE